MTGTMISSMNLRKSLGDVLNRTRYSGQRFIVERKGEPIAAIISLDELARLEQMERERDAELLNMAKAASQGVVPFAALVDQYEILHGERLEMAPSREQELAG